VGFQSILESVLLLRSAKVRSNKIGVPGKVFSLFFSCLCLFLLIFLDGNTFLQNNHLVLKAVFLL
jgi:hypothetical protein